MAATLPLKTLVIGASYLPNTTFSFKLLDTNIVTSYIGYAVSVQTASGTILGCGRLENVFPVDASYQGKNTLSQANRYFPTTVVDASNDDILLYYILDGIAGTCSSKAAIFDPWSPPGPQVGSDKTSDQFPVGDLPNHNLEVFSLLPEVPLIGSASILGHVVSKPQVFSVYSMHKRVYICILELYTFPSLYSLMHACAQVNDSQCNSIELTVPTKSHAVKAYAVFGQSMLTGRITFVSQHDCML